MTNLLNPAHHTLIKNKNNSSFRANGPKATIHKNVLVNHSSGSRGGRISNSSKKRREVFRIRPTPNKTRGSRRHCIIVRASINHTRTPYGWSKRKASGKMNNSKINMYDNIINIEDKFVKLAKLDNVKCSKKFSRMKKMKKKKSVISKKTPINDNDDAYLHSAYLLNLKIEEEILKLIGDNDKCVQDTLQDVADDLSKSIIISKSNITGKLHMSTKEEPMFTSIHTINAIQLLQRVTDSLSLINFHGHDSDIWADSDDDEYNDVIYERPSYYSAPEPSYPTEVDNADPPLKSNVDLTFDLSNIYKFVEPGLQLEQSEIELNQFTPKFGGAALDVSCWARMQMFCGRCLDEFDGYTNSQYPTGKALQTRLDTVLGQSLLMDYVTVDEMQTVDQILEWLDPSLFPFIFDWKEVMPGIYHFFATRSEIEPDLDTSMMSPDEYMQYKHQACIRSSYDFVDTFVGRITVTINGETHTISYEEYLECKRIRDVVNKRPAFFRCDSGWYDGVVYNINKDFTIGSMRIRCSGLNDIKFGVSFRYFESHKFFEYIDSTVDTEAGRAYIEKVSNYDDRIINNTMSRVNFKYLVTTKPSEKIIREHFEGITHMMQVNTIDALYDDDFTFLRDVCCFYAYSNCIPNQTELTDDVCKCLVKQPWFKLNDLLTITKTFKITTQLELNDLIDYEFVFLICPLVGQETKGVMTNSLGNYYWLDDCVYWSMHNMTEALKVSFLPQLLFSNGIEIDQGFVQVLHRKVFTCMQVLLLSMNRYSDLTTLEVEDWREYEIPIWRTNFLSYFGLDMLGSEKVTLNKKLINDLYTKNLTGNVSTQKLIEYGISLSIVKYGKSGSDITKQDLTTEQVRSHVYVVQVLRYMEKMYDQINNFILGNGFSALALAAIAAMLSVTLENYDINLDVLKIVVNNLKGAQVKNSIGMIMNIWGEIDIWSKTHSILKIVNSGGFRVCEHHVLCTSLETGLFCNCCGSLTALSHGWCRCCSKYIHDCGHVCNFDHIGDNTCSHCGDKCVGEICECCEGFVTTTLDYTTYSSSGPSAPVGSVYNAKLNKHCRTPTYNTKALSGNNHLHKCEICHNYYIHAHKYYNILHSVCDEDCPWCNDKTQPISKKCDEFGNILTTEPPKPKPPIKPPPPSLDIEISDNALSQVVSKNVYSVLIGATDISALPNISAGKLSTIPFIPLDAGVMDLDQFLVTNIIDVTTVLDCGVSCLQYYIGDDNLSIGMVKNELRKTQGLSSINLSHMLSKFNFNSCVIDKAGVWVSCVNDTEEFACIVMDKVIDYKVESKVSENHWLVCKLKRINIKNNEFYGIPLVQKNLYSSYSHRTFKMPFSKLDEKQVKYINYTIGIATNLDIDSDLNLPTLKGDKFSNSNTSSPNNGQFNSHVKPEFMDVMRIWSNAVNGMANADDFTDFWDINDSNIHDYRYHCKMNLLEIAFNLHNLITDPVPYCRVYNFTLLKQGDTYKIDISQTKLKNNDIIIIMTNDGYKFVTVNKSNNGMMIIKLLKKTKHMTLKVFIPKASVLSGFMRTVAILDCNNFDLELTGLINKNLLTIGVGGSGKSLAISNAVKRDLNNKLIPVVIAATHGGVESLRSKCPKSVSVLSVEQASYMKPIADVYYFDEVTIIKPFEIILCFNKTSKPVTKLEFYGDNLQIGASDMYNLPGTRLLYSVDYIKHPDKQFWVTWRLGTTLVKELRKNNELKLLRSAGEFMHKCKHVCLLEVDDYNNNINKSEEDSIVTEHTGSNKCSCCGNKTDSKTLCDCCSVTDKMHDTQLELGWLPDWNASEIMKFILDANVVLCFYNAHIEKVRKIINASGVRTKEVITVSSYQGRQDDIVAVIQAPVDSIANIHLQNTYCISAATRAKLRLKWMTISNYSATYDLSSRLGHSFVGFNPNLTAKNLDNNTMTEFDKLCEKVNNNIQDVDFDIELFDSKLFLYSLVNTHPILEKCSLSKSDGFVKLDLTTFGKHWYFYKSNTEVKSNVIKQFYKDKLNLMMTNCCIGKNDEGFNNVVNCTLSKIGKHNVRVLALLTHIYEMNGKVLKFKFKGETYVVSKGTGCAACCSLTFTRNNLFNKMKKVTNLAEDYLTSDARFLTGPDSIDICEFLSSYEHCNDYFKTDIFSKRSSHMILTERIRSAIVDAGDRILNYHNVLYYHFPNNVNLLAVVNKKLGTNIKPSKYADMKYMPFWTKKLFNYKVSVHHYDGERTFEMTHKLNKIGLIRDYLSTLELSMRNVSSVVPKLVSSTYMKFVGTRDDKTAPRLTGMMHDLEWHRQRKTKAYMNMSDRLGKLKIGSLAYQSPLIFVPNSIAKLLHDNYNLTHATTTNSDNIESTAISSGDIYVSNLLINEFRFGYFQLFTSTSYAGYTNKRDDVHVKAIPCDWSSQSVKNYRLSEINYDKMLQAHLNHVSSTSSIGVELIEQLTTNKVWNGIIEKPDYTLIGPAFLSCSLIDFNKIIDRSNLTFLWCFSKFERVDNMIVNFNGTRDCLWPANQIFVNALERGKCINLSTRSIHIHMIKQCYDICIYEIKNENSAAFIEPNIRNGRFINIKYPTILLDPESAILSKDLIGSSEDIFDRVILTKLTFRKMRENTDAEDLLVYARTLLNTTTLDVTDYHSKYFVSPFLMKKHVRLAMLIDQAESKRYSLVLNEEVDLKSMVKLGLFNIVGKFLDNIDVNKLIKDVLDNKLEGIFNELIVKFIENLDRLKPLILDIDRDILVNGVALQPIKKNYSDVFSRYLRRFKLLKNFSKLVWSTCGCNKTLTALMFEKFLNSQGIFIDNSGSGLEISKCGKHDGIKIIPATIFVDNVPQQYYMDDNTIYVSTSSFVALHHTCLALNWNNGNVIENKFIVIDEKTNLKTIYSLFYKCKITITNLNFITLNLISNCDNCDILVNKDVINNLITMNNTFYYKLNDKIYKSNKGYSIDYKWHNINCLKTIFKYYGVEDIQLNKVSKSVTIFDDLDDILELTNGINVIGTYANHAVVGLCPLGYIINDRVANVDHYFIVTFNSRCVVTTNQFSIVSYRQSYVMLARTNVYSKHGSFVINGRIDTCEKCKTFGFIEENNGRCLDCANYNDIELTPSSSVFEIQQVCKFKCYVYLCEYELLFSPIKLSVSYSYNGMLLVGSPNGIADSLNNSIFHTGILYTPFSLNLHDEWVSLYGKSAHCNKCHLVTEPLTDTTVVDNLIKIGKVVSKVEEEPIYLDDEIPKPIFDPPPTSNINIDNLEVWQVTAAAICENCARNYISLDKEIVSSFNKFTNLINDFKNTDDVVGVKDSDYLNLLGDIEQDMEDEISILFNTMLTFETVIDTDVFERNIVSTPVRYIGSDNTTWKIKEDLLRGVKLSQDEVNFIKIIYCLTRGVVGQAPFHIYPVKRFISRFPAHLPGTHIVFTVKSQKDKALSMGYKPIIIPYVPDDFSLVLCLLFVIFSDKPCYIHNNLITTPEFLLEWHFKTLGRLNKNTSVTYYNEPCIQLTGLFVCDRPPLIQLLKYASLILKLPKMSIALMQIATFIPFVDLIFNQGGVHVPADMLKATNVKFINFKPVITKKHDFKHLNLDSELNIFLPGAGDMTAYYLETILNSTEKVIDIQGPYGTGKTKSVAKLSSISNSHVLWICSDGNYDTHYMTMINFENFVIRLDLNDLPTDLKLLHEDTSGKNLLVIGRNNIELNLINKWLTDKDDIKYVVFDEADYNFVEEEDLPSNFTNGRQVIYISTTLFDSRLYPSKFDVNVSFIPINGMDDLRVVDISKFKVGEFALVSHFDYDWRDLIKLWDLNDDVENNSCYWISNIKLINLTTGEERQNALLEQTVKYGIFVGKVLGRGCTLDVSNAIILLNCDDFSMDEASQLIGRFGRVRPCNVTVCYFKTKENIEHIENWQSDFNLEFQPQHNIIEDDLLLPLTDERDFNSKGEIKIKDAVDVYNSKFEDSVYKSILSQMSLSFIDAFLLKSTSTGLRVGSIKNSDLIDYQVVDQYLVPQDFIETSNEQSRAENEDDTKDDTDKDNIGGDFGEKESKTKGENNSNVKNENNDSNGDNTFNKNADHDLTIDELGKFDNNALLESMDIKENKGKKMNFKGYSIMTADEAINKDPYSRRRLCIDYRKTCTLMKPKLRALQYPCEFTPTRPIFVNNLLGNNINVCWKIPPIVRTLSESIQPRFTVTGFEFSVTPTNVTLQACINELLECGLTSSNLPCAIGDKIVDEVKNVECFMPGIYDSTPPIYISKVKLNNSFILGNGDIFIHNFTDGINILTVLTGILLFTINENIYKVSNLPLIEPYIRYFGCCIYGPNTHYKNGVCQLVVAENNYWTFGVGVNALSTGHPGIIRKQHSNEPKFDSIPKILDGYNWCFGLPTCINWPHHLGGWLDVNSNLVSINCVKIYGKDKLDEPKVNNFYINKWLKYDFGNHVYAWPNKKKPKTTCMPCTKCNGTQFIEDGQVMPCARCIAIDIGLNVYTYDDFKTRDTTLTCVERMFKCVGGLNPNNLIDINGSNEIGSETSGASVSHTNDLNYLKPIYYDKKPNINILAQHPIDNAVHVADLILSKDKVMTFTPFSVLKDDLTMNAETGNRRFNAIKIQPEREFIEPNIMQHLFGCTFKNIRPMFKNYGINTHANVSWKMPPVVHDGTLNILPDINLPNFELSVLPTNVTLQSIINEFLECGCASSNLPCSIGTKIVDEVTKVSCIMPGYLDNTKPIYVKRITFGNTVIYSDGTIYLHRYWDGINIMTLCTGIVLFNQNPELIEISNMPLVKPYIRTFSCCTYGPEHNVNLNGVVQLVVAENTSWTYGVGVNALSTGHLGIVHRRHTNSPDFHDIPPIKGNYKWCFGLPTTVNWPHHVGGWLDINNDLVSINCIKLDGTEDRYDISVGRYWTEYNNRNASGNHLYLWPDFVKPQTNCMPCKICSGTQFIEDDKILPCARCIAIELNLNVYKFEDFENRISVKQSLELLFNCKLNDDANRFINLNGDGKVYNDALLITQPTLTNKPTQNLENVTASFNTSEDSNKFSTPIITNEPAELIDTNNFTNIDVKESELKKIFNYRSIEIDHEVKIEDLYPANKSYVNINNKIKNALMKISTPRQKIPILGNALGFKRNRYNYGRELSAVNSTHFTMAAAMNGVALTNTELNFLDYLWQQWLMLDVKRDEIVYLYSLSPGKCMRSPKGQGRHIHIGIKDNSITELGFETIQTLVDPGRFGACLRLVLGMLIPNTCYMRSGRPLYHIMCMENAQEIYPVPKVNTVFGCCSTLAPYMDCFVLVDRPNIDLIASCISSQLVYGEVYGTDECNLEWYNIKVAYVIPESHPYSNVKFMPNYEKYKKGVNVIELNDNVWKQPYNKQFCIQSFGDPNSVYELAKIIDVNITSKNSRSNISATPNKEVKDYIASLKVTKKTFSGLFVDEDHKMGLVNNYQVFKISGPVNLEILYDPVGSSRCVEFCISNTLKLFVSDSKHDQIIRAMNIPNMVLEPDIVNYLKMLRVNFCLFSEVGNFYYEYIKGAPALCFKIVINRNYRHVVRCNALWSKTEEIEKNVELTSLTKDDEGNFNDKNLKLKDFINKFAEFNENFTAIKELGLTSKHANNAKARLNGRIDLIMERNEGFIATEFNCSDSLCVRLQCRTLNSRRLYMILLGEKAILTGVWQSRGVQYIYCPNCTLFDGIIYNPGLNVGSIGTLLRPTIRSIFSVKTAFLNKVSKQFAVKSGFANSGASVDCNADKLIIYDYDNRVHHNEDFRHIINSKPINHLIMTDWWTDSLKLLFKYSGVIRIRCSQGIGQLCYITEKLYETKIKLKFNLYEDTVSEEEFKKLLISSERWGWQNRANILMPCKNALLAKLLESSHDLNNLNWSVLEAAISELYGIIIPTKTDNVQLKFVGYDGELATTDNNYGIYFENNKFHCISSWYTCLISFIGFSKNVNYGGLENEMDTFGEFVESDKLHFQQVKSDFKGLMVKEEKDTPREIPQETKNALMSVDALNTERYETTINARHNVSYNFEGESQRFVGNGILGSAISGEVFEEHPPSSTVNYWDDESGMLDVVIPLPNHRIALKKREEFDGFKFVKKAGLTEYPIYSRPSWNNLYGSGTSAVSNLYGGVITLRQVPHQPKVDAELFAQTYFTMPGVTENMPKFGFNGEDIIQWLKERPDFLKISKEIDEVLSDDLIVAGLRKVNVHLKLESRVKDVIEIALTGDNGFPKLLTEQRVRLIMWQRKGITALFSPTFMKCKDRLKEILIPNVRYVDGLTPLQISELLKNVTDDCDIVEDDLEKQDRQTDEIIIDTEMEIYKLLGADEQLVDIWRKVHAGKGFKWYAKGAGTTFTGANMRHTGQATTAIGNVIVNLLVRMKLVRRLGKGLKLMLVLGDDNISLVTKGVVTKEMVSENSARHWNMKSKPRVSSICGGFLRMCVYKNSVGRYECSPDFIRLQRRFEITNGVSEATDENLKARGISYLCMLGKNSETEIIKEKLGFSDVILNNWYEFNTSIKMVAKYYNMTENKVEGHYNHLLKMISNRLLHTFEKLMPVSLKR